MESPHNTEDTFLKKSKTYANIKRRHRNNVTTKRKVFCVMMTIVVVVLSRYHRRILGAGGKFSRLFTVRTGGATGNVRSDYTTFRNRFPPILRFRTETERRQLTFVKQETRNMETFEHT